ncbi:heparinase II/III domain-containing protein [Biostraticola tofi]|uniref:Alginate lyase n=1 Tax=Biostraticola tofi TaxID=466109 RepID=A0A4R3YZ07_9GAMM|nr:heparinase II/III family protein [Biostraticola tofi]TCV96764.1 alginate lyase [Biostraticola tofi]
MLQFTPEERAYLRERARWQPQVLKRLADDNEVVLAHPLRVPETGIATWGHYYFCPRHGTRLIWDRHHPHQHRCPVDNEILSGEPYDGAWWRIMNGHNCRAGYQLALLWMLTGEPSHARRVQDILLSYACYYPDYEEHGGIPCNGPGKMNIQTLCEANCILELAKGYDIVRETLSATQQEYIEQRLFRSAADFLCRQRQNQLHNHEVKVNTAIGVLGLLLQDDQLVRFAITEPYGLRWQLQHGLFDEGLWFEGSTHYHFYVLQGYFDWEKFARCTPWSLMNDRLYEKMLDFPLTLLTPDGTFPMINDAVSGQNQLHHYDIYEFAWRHYHKPAYAAALNRIYQHEPRDNLDAFLYGCASLPAVPALATHRLVHAPDAGLTLICQPEHQHGLLVKHMPFGGEHDHYDYLAITLWRHGHAVLPDLGTTGYGAALHRQYYKNSAAHNTLSVELTNAPPAVPEVRVLEQTGDGFHLGVAVDWRKAPPRLPSFSLPEWDQQAWRDIRFCRHLLVNEGLVFDIARIDNPHCKTLYWTLHIDGERQAPQQGLLAEQAQPILLGGPLALLNNLSRCEIDGAEMRRYRTITGQFTLWLVGKGIVYEGTGPANPAITDLSYLVLSNAEPQMSILACYALDERLHIDQMAADLQDDGCEIRYRCQGKDQRIHVALI